MQTRCLGSIAMSVRFCVLLVPAALCWLVSPALQAASTPVCPSSVDAPYPSLGELGNSPSVASWVDLSVLPKNCHVELQAPAALTIALAGRFTETGSIDDIAIRLGAISTTKGLPYWSVTDEDWRELVTDAFAVVSPDTNSARSDFTAQEMLSGQTLYFSQNDSRSWGSNVYSIKAIDSSPDKLVLQSNNISSIRLGPVTLFKPDEVRSVLFINRIDDTTWSYFSLAVITHSSLAARKKSLVNRQAAFYRLLIGQAPDQNPPLAP
ncbi:DUF6675 family protein [Granulosicoccus antarcticus]|nr:DUF6675 family protein [Granulosicoccus antarcticus]